MRYATEAQINYIGSLAGRVGYDKMQKLAYDANILIDDIYDLSVRQASTVIDLLKEEIANPTQTVTESDEYSYTEAEYDSMFACLDC